MKTYTFCGFWDIHCSIDIAAWLQAIGSLLALFITVGIYLHQTIKTNNNVKKIQLGNIKHFAEMVEVLMMECQDTFSLNANRKQALDVLASRLVEMVNWSSTFNVEALNHECSNSFYRSRDAIHKVALWIQTSPAGTILASKETMEDVANAIQPDINRLKNIV